MNRTLSLAPTSPSNSGARPKRNRTAGLNKGRTDRHFVTKADVKGGKLNVSVNPPEITFQPWMPLTVMIQHGGGEYKATVNSIASVLVAQVDPLRHALRAANDNSVNALGGPLFQFRFRSVRAWNLTGHMIALSVNDLTDNTKDNTDCLCGLVDTGSNSHVPAVGYELPLSHRDIVLRNNKQDKDDNLFHIITPAGDSTIIYVNIFWRFDGPSKFSSFTSSMLSMIKQIRNKVANIDRTTDDIATTAARSDEKLETLVDHTRGSIGNTIVKGIEIAAPYVISTAVAEDVERMNTVINELRLLNTGGFERVE